MPTDDELAKTAAAASASPDLARTATAVSTSTPAAPDEPVPATLGRYRLEDQLGAGGMGVVHAAFDPDLERRVALKVLRGGGSDEARRRLLREARAMAKLSHPNVITVHEVGSAGGRDYIAMELVDGGTLADWLAVGRRPQVHIIDAYVAAGRALAAAHAVGLVHRDFKPSNVLRAKTGRIVVTDFGLARASQAVDAAPSGEGGETADLTRTGAWMGTPAYMAPEQWRGGMVTPATDQFAFCVALWEALAGQRPFDGSNLDELRAATLRGPGALDASKIPRYLRKPLLRGLDPDPAQRFASMDALLRTMKRAERRPFVYLALGITGMLTLAVVFALAIKKQPASAPPCPLPALDPATVWSPATASALEAKGRTLESGQLARNFEAWSAARQRACEADPGVGVARRACLDAVLARFDAVARAVERLPPGLTVEPAEYLVAPANCERATPPRFVAPSPQLREAYGALLAASAPARREDDLTAAVARAGAEPCASALLRAELATAVRTEDARERELDRALADADRCGDDRISADVAVRAAGIAVGSLVQGSALTSRLQRAEAALARIAEPALDAQLDLVRMQHEWVGGNLEAALAAGQRAVATLGRADAMLARTGAELAVATLRITMAAEVDVSQLRRDLTALHARAVAATSAEHPLARQAERWLGHLMWSAGDLARAHQLFAHAVPPTPNEPARRVTGRVVDERGAPVAGATVAMAERLNADALGAMPTTGSLRTTTTAADGSFTIADAAHDGAAFAYLGDRRSLPVAIADTLTLALLPTGTVRGRVTLDATPANRVAVGARHTGVSALVPFEHAAPVAADGTFALVGAPRGRLQVYAGTTGMRQGVANVEVDASRPVTENVVLTLSTAGRTVDVVVRSTIGIPLGNAQVRAYSGTADVATLDDMIKRVGFLAITLAKPADPVRASSAMRPLLRRGDLHATLQAPTGAATACAYALPSPMPEDIDKLLVQNRERIVVRCAPIAPDASVVVVEVPPWPRLD